MSVAHDSPQLDDEIRSRPQHHCYLCGSDGLGLYQRIPDRLFGASGSWSHKRCPNPACGLVWLDPMPLEADIGKAYRRYYTHSNAFGAAIQIGAARRLFNRLYWKLHSAACNGYLQTRYAYRHGVGPTWHRLFGPFLSLYPSGCATGDVEAGYLQRPHAGGRLLEVGFGSAEQLTKLGKLGWMVEGVEMDAAAVDSARARGLTVQLGSLHDIAYADATFDAIFMSHVVEHVYDPIRLLSECRRILRPGGQLVGLTPNVRSLGHRVFGDAWMNLDAPRHLQLFPPAALRETAERAGLRVVRLTSSARLAKQTWTVSTLIQLRGRVDQPETWERCSGKASVAYAFLERAALTISPWLGEELVLVAERA